jgi:hypothetical protein
MSASNIFAIYQLASVADIQEGKFWYATACHICLDLAKKYSISQAQAAGVVAALSPRNKWERNILDAENLIAAYKAAGVDGCNSVKVCTFSKNKAKAIRILEDTSLSENTILDILSGPKLQEFYTCISGVEDEVCIDGHAYSIWSGGRITLANIPSIGKKLRAQIKEDYRQAAKEAGIYSYQMQAITWCVWRRIHGVNN